jgi:hypothetical protein
MADRAGRVAERDEARRVARRARERAAGVGNEVTK